MPRPLALALLLVVTMLWGFAFIFQKTAMAEMGPLTFAASRFLLGGVLVLPLAVLEYRRRRERLGDGLAPRHWLFVALFSLVFFLGSYLQQAGLAVTTVTNGGFLTSLYVLFVPLIAFIALGARPHPALLAGVPLALVGIFLLNGGRLDAFNSGDLLVTASAGFWALHVLMMSHIARSTGLPVFISAVSFLVGGSLSLLAALLFEQPDFGQLQAGWVAIAYTGVLSTAVAFTLQAIAQQHVPPANAAIVLSAEALFAALGGAVFLGERLSPVGYLGAALIFVAILVVEVLPALAAERRRAPGPAAP